MISYHWSTLIVLDFLGSTLVSEQLNLSVRTLYVETEKQKTLWKILSVKEATRNKTVKRNKMSVFVMFHCIKCLLWSLEHQNRNNNEIHIFKMSNDLFGGFFSFFYVNTFSGNLHRNLSSPQVFGLVRVAHLFSFFCLILLCVFTFWVPCCDVRYDLRIKTMFGSSLPQVVCRRVHVLFTLFVVSNPHCVVFLFCFSSSCVPYVASFSGLSIFDCPFDILWHLFTSIIMPCISYSFKYNKWCHVFFGSINIHLKLL